MLFFPHVHFCSRFATLSVAMKSEWFLLVRAYGASVFLSFHVSCRQPKPTAIKTSQYNNPHVADVCHMVYFVSNWSHLEMIQFLFATQPIV